MLSPSDPLPQTVALGTATALRTTAAPIRHRYLAGRRVVSCRCPPFSKYSSPRMSPHIPPFFILTLTPDHIPSAAVALPCCCFDGDYGGDYHDKVILH